MADDGKEGTVGGAGGGSGRGEMVISLCVLFGFYIYSKPEVGV